MKTILTGAEFAAACRNLAENYKTLYVLGCFGAPMTDQNKTRYINAQSFNAGPARKAAIQAAGADTFGFDCVCMIKGLLWGWNGDTGRVYGGAGYAVNGVPDLGADSMIAVCREVSTDFSTILPGEAVWISGHIGVYAGDGLAVECTYRWADGVQITAVHNIGARAGYNGRVWTKHGKLPWLDYTIENQEGDIEVKVSVLKKGARGEQVKALQALLTGYGYTMENNGKTYGVDGSFGGATDNAVRAYQKDHGLEVDGSVGAKTWGSLLGLE